MTRLRSLLFNAVFFGSLVMWLVILLPLVALPRIAMQRGVRAWSRLMLGALRAIVGLGYEVRGRANVPDGPAILAVKHQSTWETMIFHTLFRDPTYVLKKELFAIPLWGWYARKCRMIAVDRKAGAAALRRMVREARAALDTGRPVLIFPEGTRVAPGKTRAYQPGVFALYREASAPVVPVALNSGRFWGRRAFVKRPGTVVIEFLAPLPPGLERRAFLAELESRIEAACRRLDREAETASAARPVDDVVDNSARPAP